MCPFSRDLIKKPIPSYKVFKGDIFELRSSRRFCVITRSQEISIPEKYEIPKEIVAEAIVNALAYRDYINNGSIQVMLFSDHKRKNPAFLPWHPYAFCNEY